MTALNHGSTSLSTFNLVTLRIFRRETKASHGNSRFMCYVWKGPAGHQQVYEDALRVSYDVIVVLCSDQMPSKHNYFQLSLTHDTWHVTINDDLCMLPYSNIHNIQVDTRTMTGAIETKRTKLTPRITSANNKHLNILRIMESRYGLSINNRIFEVLPISHSPWGYGIM